MDFPVEFFLSREDFSLLDHWFCGIGDDQQNGIVQKRNEGLKNRKKSIQLMMFMATGATDHESIFRRFEARLGLGGSLDCFDVRATFEVEHVVIGEVQFLGEVRTAFDSENQRRRMQQKDGEDAPTKALRK